MPKIFVFTAGDSDARAHLADSIEAPVSKKKVFASFPESHHETLNKIHEEGPGFYAWGAVPGPSNERYWAAMERGDFVLCVYGAVYHYVARVLAKYDNKTFAESTWGTKPSGETWQYMYFLTEPMKIERPLPEFGEFLYPTRYGGFTEISDERLDRIVGSYVTIELFIEEMIGHAGAGLPAQLVLASGRSEKIAEESLKVDDVTHGTVDEKTVPDSEGRKRIGLHVSYERSSKNRERAIEIHGTVCEVCEFDFDEFYGKNYADGYIQIHHLKPLSGYEGEVDPKTDLRPLCANCHAMAHRRRDTVTSIKELRALIEKAKG